MLKEKHHHAATRKAEFTMTLFDAYEEASDEPMVLVNIFYVTPARQKLFQKSWQKAARFFKSQPGCLSYQLHQGIHDSHMFLNYVVFENTAAFNVATEHSEFDPLRETYLDNPVAHPHFFRRLRMPDPDTGEPA